MTESEIHFDHFDLDHLDHTTPVLQHVWSYRELSGVKRSATSGVNGH